MTDKEMLKKYADTSTPSELFIDAFEKIEKLEIEVNDEMGKIYDTLMIEITSLENIFKSIRKAKDGKSPSKAELLSLIKFSLPKIKNGLNGKDGSPDTGEQIVEKIRAIKKKKNKLSIFDLEDLEWLKTNLLPTLNNGTGNILGVQPPSTTSSGGFNYINEIVSGSSTSFMLQHVPVDSTRVALYGGGSRLTPGSGNDYIISGAVITMTNPYASGQVLADYS